MQLRKTWQDRSGGSDEKNLDLALNETGMHTAWQEDVLTQVCS